MWRTEDLTGVSGIGLIAEGVVWSDGSVTMRWLTGKWQTEVHHKSLQSVIDIHGHLQRTRIEFIDLEDLPIGAITSKPNGEGPA